MGPLDPQLAAERVQDRHHARQSVRESLRQGGRRSEPRKVHGDHVALGRQDLQHRLPGLPVVTYAVQQEEGFTGARALVRDAHRTWPAGALDAEGRLCRHVARSLSPPRLDGSLDTLSATITAQ
ncbi:hypothetical protein GCM10010431_76750 [Streptomyces kunmingensis]